MLEDGATGTGGRPRNIVELAAAAHREVPRQLVLARREHVDAKDASASDSGPARRGAGRRDGDEGRIERQSRKSLAREPYRLPLLDPGHDGHAGGEMAEHVAKDRRVGRDPLDSQLPASRRATGEARSTVSPSAADDHLQVVGTAAAGGLLGLDAQSSSSSVAVSRIVVIERQTAGAGFRAQPSPHNRRCCDPTPASCGTLSLCTGRRE